MFDKFNFIHKHIEILFQKVASGLFITLCTEWMLEKHAKTCFLHNDLNTPKVTRPGFHLGARKNKVVTKTILYDRHREILFQKVASGYVLHFVQNGSSKNALHK